MKMTNYRTKLKALRGKSDIKDCVIDTIIKECDKDVERFIFRVIVHGYSELDTESFYNKYQRDIQRLVNDFEVKEGSLRVQGAEVEIHSLLAFEMLVREIADELLIKY